MHMLSLLATTTDVTVHLKELAAGVAIGAGAIGPGVGIGLSALGGIQAIGRNPDAQPQIFPLMILGIVFAESVAIYTLVIALILRYT